jgi:hypothetical protein
MGVVSIVAIKTETLLRKVAMLSRSPKSQRQYETPVDNRAAEGASMPGFVEPCLATLRDKVPCGKG